MSMQYLLRATILVFVLCSVIGLTACGGGGGGDGSSSPALTPTPTPPPPSTGSAQFRITWQNSYIYQSSGTDNLYWYAQVVYQNIGSESLTITCTGRERPSLVKEHIDAGTFEAIETYCHRNPDVTRVIDPGGSHYEYAIFNKVPGTGNVALEWENYGVSQGVNPWNIPYPPNAPHPTDCPSGTCQSQFPEGKAANLIVLVHGCCTDGPHVYEWRALADAMIGEILKSQTPDAWEVVVWDWNTDTPPLLDITDLSAIGDAYRNAEHQGHDLASAIEAVIIQHSYKYIHMVAHSAGARLIQQAATDLIANNKIQQDKPFIHLTFLDAYQPNNDHYGALPNYPHYAEHYVDRGPFLFTDSCLSDAFNFDITSWMPSARDWPLGGGHQWPRYWYEQSVTTRSQTPSQTLTFPYGYPLSFEGGHHTYTALSGMYPDHLQCLLNDVNTTVPVGCHPVQTDPAYTCW